MSALIFDGQPMTKREVLIAREAADDAVKFVFEMARRLGGIEHVDGRTYVAECYPVPTVSRPRVVREEKGSEWRIVDGKIQGHGASRDGFTHWSECLVSPTPERVALWADLLASPTEEVEDES